MLRRCFGLTALTSVCLLAFLLTLGTPADAVSVSTGNCPSDTPSATDPDPDHHSCTMPELLAGGTFTIDKNTFKNFDVSEGPSSDSVVVTAICPLCGGGVTFTPGFSIDFGGTFILGEKGTTVRFVMSYDFVTSGEDIFGSTSAFLMTGAVNGALDTVLIDLHSAGYPGPDLILTCPVSTGCQPNTLFGTSRTFFSPTSQGFHVDNLIELFVANDSGGIPTVELNEFRQTFEAVPGPGSIVMMMTGFGVIGFTMARRPRSAR